MFAYYRYRIDFFAALIIGAPLSNNRQEDSMNLSSAGKMNRFWEMSILGFFMIPFVCFGQSDPPKFEAGGQYVFMHHSSFDQSNSGLGGRFGYNITRYLAAESEFDFFPQKRLVLNAIDSRFQRYYDSQRWEGLFGVKAGIRGHHIGIFGKARPGFFYVSPGKQYLDPLVLFFRPPEEAQSQLRFAMDLGGIVEIYASKRSFVRIDLGDTMINFKRSPWGDVSQKDFLSHNLQLNVGLGFRF
jgi:hypothetical protein